MQKEEITQNTSNQDVLPAIAQLLSRHDKEAFTEAPEVLNEMFFDLLSTDFGDDGDYRRRIITVLRAIRDLGHTLHPFTSEAIHKAIKH